MYTLFEQSFWNSQNPLALAVVIGPLVLFACTLVALRKLSAFWAACLCLNPVTAGVWFLFLVQPFIFLSVLAVFSLPFIVQASLRQYEGG